MKNMQQREKILALVLAGIVVVWFGLPLFESQFFGPIRELKSEEARLEENVDDLFAKRKELAVKDLKLGEWRRQSLPPNPFDAQRLYRDWLVDLALLSGFEQTAPAQPGPRTTVSDTYVTIPVTLKVRATLQELAQFLDRFESADLLHRIHECTVVSPAPEGNPKLDVTIVAEGLSLLSASPRSRLFPQTELQKDLPRDARELTVTSSIGFPEQAPFQVRIGNEFVNVVENDGPQWKIERGFAHTFPERHATAATIELFPVKRQSSERHPQVEIVWNQSLFAKPAPPIQYNPRLATGSPAAAIRNQRWSHRLEVQSWNPAAGAPRYELANAPDGMRIDERTGQITWSIDRDAEIGQRRIDVLVRGQAADEAVLRGNLTVTVRDPNRSPRFEDVPPLRFYLGRESRITVKATDPDDPQERLRYALEGAPEGMTIDSQTGEIRWTPPDSLEPGEISVTIKATDSDSMPGTASLSATVMVSEDSARFTYLVASLSRSSGEGEAIQQEREAWIYDRATNRRYVVQEGQSVRIADLEITIKQIASDHIIVERFGELFRLDFEQPLVKMRPLAQAAEIRDQR